MQHHLVDLFEARLSQKLLPNVSEEIFKGVYEEFTTELCM